MMTVMSSRLHVRGGVSWLFAAVLLGVAALVAAREDFRPFPLPEFTAMDAQGWINSAPLSVADFAGNVVLLDFWTFDCWNCYRSFPWLKELEQRMAGRDFKVLGIHTPEFEHEKVRANVVAKVKEFGLEHPVMMDNDFAYWRALGNRYWPAFYLVDRNGQVRAIFVGETHAGDANAQNIERLIEELLEGS